ncbi:MAG: beta-hydroxyacyl-ACP dehydratase [Gammaproteobacteria bacterium]|nr:beta-hydroxyacyl-ACP dehydratase [Gammaproteobacteria bacterium]
MNKNNPLLAPQILHETRADAAVRLRLRLTPDLEFFAGHFPDWPILPGVVQVHWAIALGQRYLGVTGVFRGLDNLKFHRVTPPETELDLDLQYHVERNLLAFAYGNDGGKYSSGRIVFGTPP